MKSVENFEAAGYGPNEALQYSFLGFFAGSLLTHMLDVVLEMVSLRYGLNVPTTLSVEPEPMRIEGSVALTKHSSREDFSAPSTSSNPQQPQVGEITEFSSKDPQSVDVDSVADSQPEHVSDTVPSRGQAKKEPSGFLTMSEPEELLRMGIFSAVVIFLHNLPEGLATYVSVIADPYAGAAVAVAIALHNIPEASEILAAQASARTMSELAARFPMSSPGCLGTISL
jgi:zinc transporter ZupT